MNKAKANWIKLTFICPMWFLVLWSTGTMSVLWGKLKHSYTPEQLMWHDKMCWMLCWVATETHLCFLGTARSSWLKHVTAFLCNASRLSLVILLRFRWDPWAQATNLWVIRLFSTTSKQITTPFPSSDLLLSADLCICPLSEWVVRNCISGSQKLHLVLRFKKITEWREQSVTIREWICISVLFSVLYQHAQ